MLTDKQCCFGKPGNWTQMKPGGWVRRGRPELDTSVIKSALEQERSAEAAVLQYPRVPLHFPISVFCLPMKD